MKRILVSTICCMLLGTASAAAQAPVGDAYGGAGSVTSGVAAATGSVTPSTQAASQGAQNTPSGGVESASESPTPAPAAGSTAPAAGSPAAVAAASRDLRGDSLPFTGFDIVLMLTGAGVLLVAGMGMRRLSRRAV